MSARCSRHNTHHKPWCSECVALIDEYRRRKHEKLEKLAAENQARRMREAALQKQRERKRTEKWDPDGNCILHGITPIQRDKKSFCPRCYAASRRKGQRTRKDEVRRQDHDVRVKAAITVDAEIWECFCDDVFRRGIHLSRNYRLEMGKQLRTLSKKAA